MGKVENIVFYVLIAGVIALSVAIHFMSLGAQQDALEVISQYEDAIEKTNATLKDVTQKLSDLKVEREFLMQQLAQAKATTELQKKEIESILGKVNHLKKELNEMPKTNYTDSTDAATIDAIIR